MKEPQSYGSNEDWLTGKTGQEVTKQKSAPPPEHRDFYDERRESEHSAPHQGGHTSEEKSAEGVAAAPPVGPETGENEAGRNVTVEDGGARRDSYFKRRDYD